MPEQVLRSEVPKGVLLEGYMPGDSDAAARLAMIKAVARQSHDELKKLGATDDLADLYLEAVPAFRAACMTLLHDAASLSPAELNKRMDLLLGVAVHCIDVLVYNFSAEPAGRHAMAMAITNGFVGKLSHYFADFEQRRAADAAAPRN